MRWRVSVSHPTGVFFDPVSDVIFVSVVRGDGAVVRFDMKHRACKKGVNGGDTPCTPPRVSGRMRAPHGLLGHPAGLTLARTTRDGDVFLFVLAQDKKVLLRFDPVSGNYLDVVLSNLPDVPEHVLAVPYA